MKYGAVSLVLAFGLSVVACGGGGNGGSGSAVSGGTSVSPTPIDAVGRIDAFGSIYVNGIKFETSGSRILVDDNEAFDDSALSVGMVVRVKGTRDDDRRGRADEVYYDDEIEGPIANLAADPDDGSLKRFTIFETAIVANAVSTVFKGEDGASYSFDDLANGHHVEVSGDFLGDTILATFIEKEDDDDVEVKGSVSAFDGTGFVLTLRNGKSLNITLAPGVVLPPVGLMDGQFVEVKGTLPDPVGAPNDLLALRVEIEDDDDFDDDDDDDDNSGPGNGGDREADIEGIINLEGDVWRVRMTELRFDAGTEYRPASLAAAIGDGTANGLRVKVRGDLEDSVLVVDRIEIEGEDDLEVKGFVESVSIADDGTAELTISFPPASGTVAVLVTNRTMLKNDDGLLGFELSDLIPGTSFVEIHGSLNADGILEAGVLEAEDNADEYEIEGPLDQDGFINGASISVLGVVFTLDGDTLFEDGLPRNGDIVDVEDTDRDGIADEVDVED